MAKLHFYYSAMNAGKSTTLLQSSYNYQERGMKTLLLSPLIDNRYGENTITSRIGLASRAISFTAEIDLYHFVKNYIHTCDMIQCVFVDEAQFLKKQQVWQLTQIVDQCNIPVLAYGLRTDFQGESFEGSRYLLAWAEDINEIKTICYCGKKAIMNARIDHKGNIIKQGEQIKIGGNHDYIAVCRKHFNVDKIPEKYLY